MQLFYILFPLEDATLAPGQHSSAVRTAEECWPAWETDVSPGGLCSDFPRLVIGRTLSLDCDVSSGDTAQSIVATC